MRASRCPGHSPASWAAATFSEHNRPTPTYRQRLTCWPICWKAAPILPTITTASDGSFYLSNLLPGSYTLEVDPDTIPEGYIVLEMSKTIELFQGQDFQEIEIPPIYAIADLERSILR